MIFRNELCAKWIIVVMAPLQPENGSRDSIVDQQKEVLWSENIDNNS